MISFGEMTTYFDESTRRETILGILRGWKLVCPVIRCSGQVHDLKIICFLENIYTIYYVDNVSMSHHICGMYLAIQHPLMSTSSPF